MNAWLFFVAILLGGSSNSMMGKFTQSVRRIVADVNEGGTMSGLSREEVIEINERLRLFRVRLEHSYETAKQALNALMAKYGDSKSQRNIFNRYPLLKIMIKVICGRTVTILMVPHSLKWHAKKKNNPIKSLYSFPRLRTSN